jgi:ribosome-associated protein
MLLSSSGRESLTSGSPGQKAPQAKRRKMKLLEITNEPIELYKVLKLDGMVPSGGAAKSEIADGRVLVNGAVETRNLNRNGDLHQ